MSADRARSPGLEDERQRIRSVLMVGIAGGIAIWIAVAELTGAFGVFTLVVVCVLVGAATARMVSA